MRKQHNHGKEDKDSCDDSVPCFTTGSLVLTSSGKKLVQNVRAGDCLLTRDNGYQKVTWAGSAKGNTGVLYNGTILSEQHKIVCRVDSQEVLVPAKHLVRAGLATKVVKPLTFVHFMFTQHEIVNVDDFWSESFFPGTWVMDNTKQGREIKLLFGPIRMLLARPVCKFKQGGWVTEDSVLI